MVTFWLYAFIRSHNGNKLTQTNNKTYKTMIDNKENDIDHNNNDQNESIINGIVNQDVIMIMITKK